MKNSFRSVFYRFALIECLAAAASAQVLGDRVDVSRIVDKAVAESALGEPVKAPSPRSLQGEDGYYSKCNYYSATSGKVLILRLYQASAGTDVRQQLDTIRSEMGAGRSVSGLGDKAQIYSGTASGLAANVVMLYVIKSNSLVTVGISGLEEDIASEKAKRLALQIVKQVR
jgi:hypothetical protein